MKHNTNRTSSFLTLGITLSILFRLVGNDGNAISDFAQDIIVITNTIDTVEENKDTMFAFFELYKDKAQCYLDRGVFDGTPLTGEILSTCAKNAYDSTGIIVPLELALSQAQLESGMGRKGLSPTNNPYNVGEWDEGSKIKFKNTMHGVQSYYYLIANNYLKNTTLDDLLTNFVSKDGYRYASKETYEESVSSQCSYIERWLTKNMSA